MADRRRSTTPRASRSRDAAEGTLGGRSVSESSWPGTPDGGQQGDSTDLALPYVPHWRDGVVIGDPVNDPVVSPVLVYTPPPVPTGLSASSGANENIVYFNVSWAAPVGDGADNVQSYNLQYKRTPDSNWVTVRSTLTAIRVQPVEALKSYDFRVQAVSWAGITGPFAGTFTLSAGADAAAPAQVTGLVLSAGLRTVFAQFNALTEADLDHYRIQVSTNVGMTALVHDGFADANLISVSDLSPATQYWVRVAGLDRSGNQGTYSSIQTITTPTAGSTDLAADSVIATKLAAITMGVGKYIQSTSYSAGVTGWHIDANGDVEFNNGTFRGTVEAGTISAGTISRSTLAITSANSGGAGLPITGFNGSFNVNITGWAGNNCTLAQVASPVFSGAGAMRLTAVSNGTMQAFTPTGLAGFPVLPGRQYIASSRFRSAFTARGCRVRVFFYDAAGLLIPTWHAGDEGNLISTTDSSAAYTSPVLGFATSPPTAVTAAVSLTVLSAVAAEQHYVDVATFDAEGQFGFCPNADVDGAYVNEEGDVSALDFAFTGDFVSHGRLTGTAGCANYGLFLDNIDDETAYEVAVNCRSDVPTTPNLSVRLYAAWYSGSTFLGISKSRGIYALDDTLRWLREAFTAPEGADSMMGGVAVEPSGVSTGRGLTLGLDQIDISQSSLLDAAAPSPEGRFSLDSVPPGFEMKYRGIVTGTDETIGGWLPEAGQAVSRTYYANLYAAIGDDYGAGDGVTTFNLPTNAGFLIKT